MLAGNIFNTRKILFGNMELFIVVTILNIEGIPEYEVNVSDAIPLAVTA